MSVNIVYYVEQYIYGELSETRWQQCRNFSQLGPIIPSETLQRLPVITIEVITLKVSIMGSLRLHPIQK